MKFSVANQFDSSTGKEFLNSLGHQRNGNTTTFEARAMYVTKVFWGVPLFHVTSGGPRDLITTFLQETEYSQFTNPAGALYNPGIPTFMMQNSWRQDWKTGVVTGTTIRYQDYDYRRITTQPPPDDHYAIQYIVGGVSPEDKIFTTRTTSQWGFGGPTATIVNTNTHFEGSVPVLQVDETAIWGYGDAGPGKRESLSLLAQNDWSRTYDYAKATMDTLPISAVPWKQRDTRHFKEWVAQGYPFWPSKVADVVLPTIYTMAGCDGTVLPPVIEGNYTGSTATGGGFGLVAGVVSYYPFLPGANVSKGQFRSLYAPYIVVRAEGYISDGFGARPFRASDYSLVQEGIARDWVPVDIPEPVYADDLPYDVIGPVGSQVTYWKSAVYHNVYFNLSFSDFLIMREAGTI